MVKMLKNKKQNIQYNLHLIFTHVHTDFVMSLLVELNNVGALLNDDT